VSSIICSVGPCSIYLIIYLLHQLLLQGFLCMQSRMGDCLEKGGWVINWLSINVMIIYVTADPLK
jgi:hypothetical protein